MLLVDNILLLPWRGFMGCFKAVRDAAVKELFDEERVKAELSELYMMLETEKITEEEFKEREQELISELEVIAEYRKTHPQEEED
ncbi:MAG TPA: gas vesicle protein GvpG [Candidatus Hypogeohydataceae bacterium YC38]